MGTKISLLGAALALILLAQSAGAQNTVALPPIDVGTSRLGGVITGASSSVITADDIEHSPAQSLPDILSQVAGVQVMHLFGSPIGTNDMVDLRGFGAFAVRESAARTGRNPQTGAPIEIAARKVPTFKAGKELRDRVNRPAS